MPTSKFLSRALLAQCMALAFLAMLPARPVQAGNNCDTQQGGIGGTGAPVEHGGIGGTGDPAKGSGMGGTGSTAQDSGIGGTGITGIITGFASICVNGMEVHYDSSTPLEINGQPASANELAVGQLVHAEATGTGDEVVARKISVRHAVSGPVSNVNNGKGQIRVMGQIVQLTDQTINVVGVVQPGDFIRVSGLRKQDGVVVAARIERTSTHSIVSVSGPVSRTGKREFNIANLRVVPENGKMPEGLATGREVHVHGQLQGGMLKAEKIEVAPAIPFGGRNQRLELQGYVGAIQKPGKLRVGETQMELSSQTLAGNKLAPGQLVRVSAHLTSDRRVVVEHIQPVRNYFERKELHNTNGNHERRSIKEGGSKDNGKASAENRSSETRKSDRDGRSSQEKTERSEKHKENSHRLLKKDIERNGQSERLVRSDYFEHAEQIETFERFERDEMIETLERVERVEKTEAPERVERVEKIETPERVETPEKH